MILQIPVIVEDDCREDSTGIAVEVKTVVRSEHISAVAEACKNVPVVDDKVCEVLMTNGTVFIVNVPYERMHKIWIDSVSFTEGANAGFLVTVEAQDPAGFGDLA